MIQTKNNVDFRVAFKAAIIESLYQKGLITTEEKQALESEILSLN